MIFTLLRETFYKWGRAKRVSLDAGKESRVLSRHEPAGGNFKILSVIFDCKLIMDDAVHDVAIECASKLERLLRSRKFINGRELLGLYKAHVLSLIEYRTSALYHASCAP